MRPHRTITVKLSEWESRQLDQLAEQQALTISAWVRQQIEVRAREAWRQTQPSAAPNTEETTHVS
jgi:predicted transcriptional regulator